MKATIIILAALSATAQAQTAYKCVGPSGETVYSTTRCPEAPTEVVVSPSGRVISGDEARRYREAAGRRPEVETVGPLDEFFRSRKEIAEAGTPSSVYEDGAYTVYTYHTTRGIKTIQTRNGVIINRTYYTTGK